jgi:hypothetical protein
MTGVDDGYHRCSTSARRCQTQHRHQSRLPLHRLRGRNQRKCPLLVRTQCAFSCKRGRTTFGVRQQRTRQNKGLQCAKYRLFWLNYSMQQNQAMLVVTSRSRILRGPCGMRLSTLVSGSKDTRLVQQLKEDKWEGCGGFCPNIRGFTIESISRTPMAIICVELSDFVLD